jgi:glutathione S-transferase
MKLFYASGSPYARIIRVVVRELRLDNEIEEIEVTLRDPHSPLLPYNPGGKVPTLQLDNGTILNESMLVLAYLDTQHGGRKLLPMDGSDGWKTLSELGRAYALLDAVTVEPRTALWPEDAQRHCARKGTRRSRRRCARSRAG